jgi:hypothetical protein
MFQQQPAPALQRTPAAKRPPTPDPFVEPLYIKYEFDSATRGYMTRRMDLCTKRTASPQAQSRVHLMRLIHKNQRAASIHRLKAAQTVKSPQTTIAQTLSNSTASKIRQEHLGLPEAIKGLQINK